MMFDYIKNILLGQNISGSNSVNEKGETKIQIATCALFLEMAKSDLNFTEEERSHIFETMKSIFQLDDEFVKDLLKLSEIEVKESISLYEFTDTINQHFSNEEKFELLKNLWKLIFIDGKIDAHEEGLIRKITTMLNLEHRDMIDSKMIVKKELNL